MGYVTMTQPTVFAHDPSEVWTIEQVQQLPDNGLRYELLDGSLVVSPHAAVPHIRIVNFLRDMLRDQCPAHLYVGQDGGVAVGQTTYFVPDIFVVRRAALHKADAHLNPSDLLLVVEVLSPSNAAFDLVTKRHHYAALGIPPSTSNRRR
jgi:Uma2 family endonuclease